VMGRMHLLVSLQVHSIVTLQNKDTKKGGACACLAHPNGAYGSNLLKRAAQLGAQAAG